MRSRFISNVSVATNVLQSAPMDVSKTDIDVLPREISVSSLLGINSRRSAALRHSVILSRYNPDIALSLHFVNNSLESGGVVESQVGKHLAVDFDAGLVNESHELRVRKTLHTGGGIDSLNPKRTEVALFVLAVAVSVGETLFPSILGNGPHVTTATEVTAG